MALIASFIALGIFTYNRNMKRNKHDLLKFIKKHKDKLSITLIEDGIKTLEHNSSKKLPLASTMKIIIAYSLVKEVGKRKLNLNEPVNISDLNNYYIKNTDGGSHEKWLNTSESSTKVTLLEVAKGMMHHSSNACTDFLIDRIGVNVINHYIQQLNLEHDPISFLTPSVLLPAYLSESKRDAIKKIKEMSHDRYQNLSNEIFNMMKNDKIKTEKLKENLHKNQLLSLKTQKSLTYRMPKSTTNEYADLMYQLGQGLLNTEEKRLFDSLLLGDSVKQDGDQFFWFKGGATLFMLTSALYKESNNQSLSLSVFIEDEEANNTYWMRNAFNSFVISIAKDEDFRNQLKKVI